MYKGYKSKQAYDKYQRELMRKRRGTKNPRNTDYKNDRKCPVCEKLLTIDNFNYDTSFHTICKDCNNQKQNEDRWVIKEENKPSKMYKTIIISIDDSINYFSINNVGQSYSKQTLIQDISILLNDYLTIVLYDTNHANHEPLFSSITKTYNKTTLENVKIIDGLTGLMLFTGEKFKEEIIPRNKEYLKPYINDPQIDEYGHKTMKYSKDEAEYEQSFVDKGNLRCEWCDTDKWDELIPYIMFNKKTGNRYFAVPDKGVFPRREHQDHPDWKIICRKCFNRIDWRSQRFIGDK